MKKFILCLLAVLLSAFSMVAEEYEWKASWITRQYYNSSTNSWLMFKKHLTLDSVPESVTARIAADTKYWLWINGELVVREGGLKRGPEPGGTYYDKIEIGQYLVPGENAIAALVWYFGQNGFSHMSSGTGAFLFDAQGEGLSIVSDGTWESGTSSAISTASCPKPNHRLPESSLRVDGRRDSWTWTKPSYKKRIGSNAVKMHVRPGDAPFGRLVERPIPMWKDYGMKEYESVRRSADTMICQLPYNCHVTPYLKVSAPAGKVILIETDHSKVGPEEGIRAEYVTRNGSQEFECYGWINGEQVRYVVPDGVEVEKLMYRETGYDAEFAGSFECDDELLNQYWQKSVRSLYVCMRDTYMDCPDRERAQWWGDEVHEMTMAFYSLSPSSWALARKGILELVKWQSPEGILYAPVPCGNYFKELPMQILATVGWYGIRTFCHYADDTSFLPEIYPAVHRYLHEVWELDGSGLPVYRTGDWDWPDAGENHDRDALLPSWFYLALKGEAALARMLGNEHDALEDEAMMQRLATSFNERYWNGTEYRGKENGPADDRVQAMAVVSGLAGPDKYDALIKSLESSNYSTTYMTRYALEALCVMGRADMAIERMHEVYPTIMKDGCSTLYEHRGWKDSSNHGWSGNGIIILAENIAGVRPLEPGFRSFSVDPQMGGLKRIRMSIPTAYGPIGVSLDRTGKRIKAVLDVPKGTSAVVPAASGKTRTLPEGRHELTIKK